MRFIGSLGPLQGFAHVTCQVLMSLNLYISGHFNKQCMSLYVNVRQCMAMCLPRSLDSADQPGATKIATQLSSRTSKASKL